MISGQRCLVRGRVTEAGEFLELDRRRPAVAGGQRRGTERDPDARLHSAPPGAHQPRLWQRHPDGLAPLRPDPGVARISQPQRTSVHLCRSRHGPAPRRNCSTAFDVKPSEVPVVICNGRNVLRSPSIQELANCLGFNSSIDWHSTCAIVIIVGAGPAGLAAAVYARIGGPGCVDDRERTLRAARRVRVRRSRTTSAFPRAFRDRNWQRAPRAGAEVRRHHDDRAQRGAAQLRPAARTRLNSTVEKRCRRAPS